MTRVGLLYQKEHHARALAATLSRLETNYTADVLTLSDLWNANEYDIFQTDELIRYGTSAVAAGRFSDTPVVAHVQGWDDYTNAHSQYNPVKYSIIRVLIAIASSGVEGVIYVSQATRRYFPYSFDRYGYATPLLDTDSYMPTQLQGKTNLLTVTNLRYREKLKGIQTILDGLKPLFAAHDDLCYRIAGGGEQLDTLRDIVSTYPYADRVSVLGFRNDVPKLLVTADLFVYVSYLDSLAMTVLEAQAAGVPIVAGDCGGVPEAVADAGIVCPPTAKGVSRAVRTLVRNDDLRMSFAAAGRERMTAHNRRQAHRHVALWDEVLHDRA